MGWCAEAHGGGGCRGTSCQMRLLIVKLNKAAARSSANDGGYSLTKRLLVLTADQPAAQKHSAGPQGRRSPRGQSAPHWEGQDTALLPVTGL